MFIFNDTNDENISKLNKNVFMTGTNTIITPCLWGYFCLFY